MNAACHRCGGTKSGPLLPCPECRHTPRGGDRSLAWLFSSAHLSPDELVLAAQRIQAGEMPDPSTRLLQLARRQIDSRMSRDDTPLSTGALIALGSASLILTPLAGLAVWWGLRDHRPHAAGQTLRVTIPIAAALGALWVGIILSRLLG